MLSDLYTRSFHITGSIRFFSCLSLSRVASVPEWEIPWVKLPWTSLTNLPPHRLAERSNNYWEVRTCGRTHPTPIQYVVILGLKLSHNSPTHSYLNLFLTFILYFCSFFSNHLKNPAVSCAPLDSTAHRHKPLLYRCFSCDASACTEGLL